ncbi:hypothetical protein Tco_0612465 [Tanacetum coccineum]
MDGGDDGDDDDGDSYGDDAEEDEDDEDEDKEDEEGEEKEHLAPADYAIVVPVDEPIFPSEGTEPVIPPPHTDNYYWGLGLQSDLRLFLIPLHSGGRCMAPSAHSSPLLPSSGCPTQIQILRIASTQALIDAVTAALPSHPLPSLPPSIYIPPPVDHRDEIPESEHLPPEGLWGLLGRSAIEAVPEIASMTLGEVNTRVIELAELHEHDTQDLYALLEDAQDSRSRISQRVDRQLIILIRCGRDILMGDWMTSQETIWMVEVEAPMIPERLGSLRTKTQLQLQAELLSCESSRRRASTSQDQRLGFLITRMLWDADSGHLVIYVILILLGQFILVVGLTRWIEKMESVFNISGFAIKNQVKFATYTLLGATLTWWNGQIRTLGPEAYAMTWEVLKKKMTVKYCPQGVIMN